VNDALRPFEWRALRGYYGLFVQPIRPFNLGRRGRQSRVDLLVAVHPSTPWAVRRIRAVRPLRPRHEIRELAGVVSGMGSFGDL
jgi:hypothetical protein